MHQETNCRNCKQPINDSKYCPGCGQKNTDGRISIGEFFSVLLSTVFNLESKFFMTMRDIFVPGKLTKEWFKGRHKPYFHPMRLFIVFAFLLIAALSKSIAGTDDFVLSGHKERVEKELHRKEMLKEISQFSNRFNHQKSKKQVVDSLITSLEKREFHSIDKQLRKIAKEANIDTEDKTIDEIEAEYSKIVGEKTIEEIKKAAYSRETKNRDSIWLGDFQMFNMGENKMTNQRIANHDFIHLSPEELLEKYKVEGTFNRLVFRQKVKLMKGDKAFLPFILANSIWVGLLMMPFFTLILKLLYIRRNYFYVEHLIFSFHLHAFAFLILTISYFLSPYVGFSIGGVAAIGILLYLYRAMRSVYQQSRLKTILKMAIVLFTYLILFILFIALGFLVGLFLF